MNLKLITLIVAILALSPLPAEYNVELLGNRQTVNVNQWLKEDISLRITDENDIPVSGVAVEFITSHSEVQMQEQVATTDENGLAGTGVKLGSKMGDYDIDAVFNYNGRIVRKRFTHTAFDYKELIFYLLGGLGLFLFGIRKVSESLKILGGDSLKRILSKITANRFLGIGVGLAVTTLLQSSSATTVMTIGFVNASLMSLRQAISVIIGANIGTTITAQIIAFKIGEIALPAIAIGSGLILFSKTLKIRSYGSIVLGFGLVFFGLNMMTGVVSPIKSSVFISDFFLNHSHNYLLAIFAGTVMTMLVQSSSATVGITMVLAVSGLIDLKMSMALVLGDNIGTTITAILASIGSSVNARRTSLSHFIFNMFGAAYMFFALIMFGDQLVSIISSIGGDIARNIANFHTLFNVFNMLLFIPLIPLLEKIVTRFIPESVFKKKGITNYLDESLLAEPTIAIDQIKLELGRMMHNVQRVVGYSLRSLDSINSLYINETFQAESENDQYQLEITDYIARLSRQELYEEDAVRLPVLLHVTNDLEKAADFSRNIAELAERKLDKGLEFSEQQKVIIGNMGRLVNGMLDNLLTALENNDQERAMQVARQESVMDKFEIRYKKEQIKDISQGMPVESAIMTMDIITNIEKIGDHLYNVAQAIMGALSEDKRALYSNLLINTH